MKNTTLIFTAAVLMMIYSSSVFSQKGRNQLERDECYNCHKEQEILPDGFSELDLHLQKEGLSCAGCHGGDPNQTDEDKAMDPAKGFVGAPDRTQIPKFCGKCHSNIAVMRVFQPRIATDQVSQYYTSVHGKMFKKGDKNVATCISCHTSHSILPAEDTRSTIYAVNLPKTCNKCHGDSKLMNKYGLESDQYKLYAGSVHGKALLENLDTGAPSCNDCHGNHGAAPPGVKSVTHVCGTCHANNLEYFTKTKMAQEFEEMGFHGCEQCHGYHSVQKTSDDLIGVGESSFCVDCHDEGEEGYKVAEAIHNDLKKVVGLYDSAKAKIKEVKIKGMNDVDIEYVLKEAHQNIIQTRTLVHTFDSNKVHEKTAEGAKISLKALKLADEQIDEYYTRRIGLGIASIAFLFLAIALFFKIRSLDKKKPKKV